VLNLETGSIRPFVLAVGDPKRVEAVAKMCSDVSELSFNREYRIVNATYQGAPLTIASHGVGGPGASVCFEELISIGATTIVRMGTCGSLNP
jgi:uridine phosphorylase